MSRIKHLTIGLFLSLFLLACVPTTPEHGGRSGGHEQGSVQKSKDLIVSDLSRDSEIAFSVRDGDETFSDYGVSHTKEMHLIVVRDDLRYFQHLHPERDTDNIWRVPFTVSAGGTYWLYADLVDSDEEAYTIRFDKQYPGDPGAHGIVKNFEKTKTVDGYRFTFHPEVSGSDVTFTYDIRGSEGQRVELEEYLGATGHSVLISPSGDFIHTHPSSATPVFSTALPSDDFYRIFTQFQIRGEVYTISFDWERERK